MKKTMFWTAALAGGMWTPLYEGQSFTPAQAVKYCEQQLARRSGKMPNGEFEVAAVKAVSDSGAVTIIVKR
jgi:hypothetical protein